MTLYVKYRPESFEDMVGNEAQIKALHTVLNSANTVKQLLDLKPDFAKYIKDNEKPKQTTALVPQKDLDYVSTILKDFNSLFSEE